MNNYILLITMHADPAMPPGYDEWGGTNTYMKELMDCFGKLNINCLVITRKSLPDLPDVEKYNSNCKVYRLLNGEPEPLSKLMLRNYHQHNLKEIQAIVEQQETIPQVIHSVYWNSGRLALELSQYYGIKFVHSVISNARGRSYRGAIEPLPDRQLFEQEIYDAAHKILCVSTDEKNDLVKFYNISQDKLLVAGQYIDEAFINPAHDENGFPRLNTNISSDLQQKIASNYNNAFNTCSEDLFWTYKVFTYLGRMDFNKGIEHILNSWYLLYSRYGNNCPPLWIVGGSIREINMVRQKAKAHNFKIEVPEAEGKLIWWGYLDVAGLSTILLKTSALLMHSLYEPGGRVVIEAMSEGVPVIATPNGFAKDVIIDWQNGFFVPYGEEQKLAIRMEHFIRQPLLADALGRNAKETATNTRVDWDFTQKHIYAYGITEDVAQPKTVMPLNYFANRKVNLFPYYTKEVSAKEIASIIVNFTEETIIGIKKKYASDFTSNIWELVTDNGNIFYLKQFFTRLSLGSMYNPFDQNYLVRHAEKCYECEKFYYTKAKSSAFVGYDDLHKLIITQCLRQFPVENIDDISLVVNHLIECPSFVTIMEAKQFDDIIYRPVETFSDIANVFENLQDCFRYYYFEHSGVFSNHLAWIIAPYLLSYNKSIIKADIFSVLEGFIEIFSVSAPKTSVNQYCSIDIDTEIKHIMHNGHVIDIIDHEKISIGTKEIDIAGFLFDLSKKFPCNWLKILSLPQLENLCQKSIISNVAYRYFYDAIIDSVLGSGHPNTQIKTLMELEFFFQDII